MARDYAIGIDLGGTNIKGGVCDADGRLHCKDSIATEAEGGADHVIRRIADLIARLIDQAELSTENVAGVGIGAPGPMSHSQGIVYGAPNLPGWVNIPLKARLQELTGLPTTLENDANAAAYGEFVGGAGSSVQTLVMLTLGTGIGGGIVLDGQLWRGAFDNAAEVGHIIVVPGGRPCPCGQRGCYERYASANAVAERLIEAVRDGEQSRLVTNADAEQSLDARAVLAARNDGDALAARIWDETCYYLALGIVALQHVINPELVVLAGGLINAGEDLLAVTQRHFDELRWKIAPDEPRLALAELGTDAGAVGAAMLAHASA